MAAPTAIAAALLAPAAGALAVSLLGARPNLRETATLVATAVTLWFVVSLVPEVMAGGRPELVLFETIPGVPLAFLVEPLGMLFALVASSLWLVTSLYSIGYMRGHHEKNQTRFFVCFAIAISAAIGVAFAANLITLFLFYEVLTLSTYPLVTHRGTPEAVAGGRTYLGVLLGTSIAFLLLAILWTWQVAGTLDFRPGGILAGRMTTGAGGVLLGLYAFGIGKAALMPFHRWLPAAMVAPAPVSALLHAVAVVKAGVFSVLKVAVYVFGIDFLREGGLSVWLLYVASFTLLATTTRTTQDTKPNTAWKPGKSTSGAGPCLS